MTSGLAAGTVFAERYRVVRPIAAGGMGSVYEVIHLETERRRALKVMHSHILQSDELRERFQREAKVAAQIESEFIVDVFDAGFDVQTQMPYLVMELLRGEELSKRLKRMRRLPPIEVVTFLHQTALALDRTHKASIVHRDLKPENLFITEREDGPPRVKVLDFGIAKIVAESATTQGATQSLGTPLYMAPEQFDPRARLTPAADLYALGMVAYTLLVGAPYWAEEARGGNVFALATVVVKGPPEPASQRAAARGVTLPPSFDAWFGYAAAADPIHRFATATEMIGALAQALGMPPPGRAQAMSLSGGLEGMPFSQRGSVPALSASAPVATGRGSAGAGTAALPPSAQNPTPASPAHASGSAPQPSSGAFAIDPRAAAPFAMEPSQPRPFAMGTPTPTAFEPPLSTPPAFTPPRAHITGPGTATTRPVLAGKGRGLALGAAVALGVLVGGGIYVASRTNAAPPGAAPASEPPVSATVRAEPTASESPRVVPVEAPTTGATSATNTTSAPSATSATAPSATAPSATGAPVAKTAEKPGPAAPAVKAPAAVVAPKKKYSRD